MTTLKCGHPQTCLTDEGHCGACLRTDADCWVARWRAAQLCGLPDGAFDDLTTDEHEAFHESIAADPNPTGLDPRLVYASYLEEQGDPRGELIRVECELRGLENSPGLFNESIGVATAMLRSDKRWQALSRRRAALRLDLGYDKPQETRLCEMCGGGGLTWISRAYGQATPRRYRQRVRCPRCNGTGRVENQTERTDQ